MGGFSFPELIAVLIIIGVLAAVAMPKFSATVFGYDEVRFHQQTLAALRHAQRTAVTTQRWVCATFTGTTLILRYAKNYDVTTCAAADGVTPPGGGSAPYTVTAQGSAGYSATPTDFTYSKAGRPSLGQTIMFTGGKQIVIEAETGYAH